MLIVLEGCDGGGKTTLVRKLADLWRRGGSDHHVELLHQGRPPKDFNPFETYELALTQGLRWLQVLSTNVLVLADRWHLGEAIYGPLFRGTSALDDGGLLHVELALATLGAVKVLAQPEDAIEVERRLRYRGDDFVPVGMVSTIHQRYEELAKEFGYIRADDVDPEKLIIQAQINTDAVTNKFSFVNLYPGWLGSYAPHVVLVGDRRNPRGKVDPYRHPFTPVHNGSSAKYLMNALAMSSLSVVDLAIINANEDGMDLSSFQEDLLLNSSVVALGNLASDNLRRAGVLHKKVPHPQWWRRFKHSDVAGYANAIEEAAGAS